MTENNGYSLSDIAAATGNGINGGFGDGGWWIILLFIFIAAFGGWGNGGYGAGGVQENYVLTSDFSQLSRQLADSTAMTERKLDSVTNGLCDGFYTTAQQINGVNTNILTTANANQMAVMQGFNTTQAQLADCCCKTQQNIKDTQYVIGSTGAGIQTQIATVGSDIGRQIERGFADTNYAMATQNCATLQAIDKVGDRIIDRLTQDKLDALRDENATLRLTASQSAQNQYLINQLRPCPQPAYVVPNPYCNCNCNNGFNYGTTIA